MHQCRRASDGTDYAFKEDSYLVMEKINFPRKFKVYLPLILIFMLLVAIMPRSSRFNYDYRKGSPWQYETLIAQFDFPVLKTEEQYQKEVEQAWLRVVPYYVLDHKVAVNSQNELSAMDFGEYAFVKPAVSDAVTAIYSKGVLPALTDQGADGARQSVDGMIYVQKDRRAVKVPVSEVYSLEKATYILKDAVAAACPDSTNVDSLYVATGLNDPYNKARC